jgi:hypothetical protein
MTYDDWLTTNPADAELGSSAPPNPYPGLRPMSEAPRADYTKPIIVILADYDENKDPRREVFWSEALWSDGGLWFDANGDGAPDGKWDRWEDDELAGWLETVAERDEREAKIAELNAIKF